MIKAVIVDVDDTLCLTEATCFDLENTALVRMGRKPMSRPVHLSTRPVHLSTWGQPLFDAIQERSPGIDVEEFKVVYHPVIEEFIAEGKLDAIPDENYKTLDRLIELGKTIMLLTSRTHGEFKHMLEPDHLLSARVKAFYYKDKMRYYKPNPRAFDELLSDHSLEPEDCVYVGDSPGDAMAANQRGLSFIASLESGIRQREDFAEHKVDVFINKFPELFMAVKRLDQMEDK